MAEYRFKKIDAYRWELPRTGTMRVPGLVYTSEKMLGKIERERVAEQMANVATLPGIVGYSLAMPDAHWGYGFPVGGVSAMDLNDGVISPGGIGYDISCLTEGSRVLHGLGYTMPIEQWEHGWKNEPVSIVDFSTHQFLAATINQFYKKPVYGKAYRLVTKTGRQITATHDHPFYTEDGMKPLDKISSGDLLALYPFQGVAYEDPCSDILVSEEHVITFLTSLGKGGRGSAIGQVTKELRDKGLLPLRFDSPQLPYLIKLLGYLMGDGTLFFLSKQAKHGMAWFFGSRENLEAVRQDAYRASFCPSKVYSRIRKHKIKTFYKEYQFEHTEDSCRVGGTSFAALMACLGCPIGNKADQVYRVPAWIFRAPLWQKRLFLAAYFGAELSSPKNLSRQNFYCPALSVSKRSDLIDSAVNYLDEISKLLTEFGVRTLKISPVPDHYTRVGGKISQRVRLILAGDAENLINLYSRVGFEYHRQKAYLANVATQYLKEKQQELVERERFAREAVTLRANWGWGAKKIKAVLGGSIPIRFVERSIYEGRKTQPRVWNTFPSFEEYSKMRCRGLGNSGMVWDTVVSKEAVPYHREVYDFTVNHPSHNFIAEGFVVSNCGVRLLRSDLKADEIRPKISKLMDALFHAVPSGVGSEGPVSLSKLEMQQVFKKGAPWAIEKGYGNREDAETIEDGGFLEGADPLLPSTRSVERGRNQLGTLGSGNHFLEVQEVDEIYDLRTANVFGLFKGQVVVLIHTGSRGCGYQICEDFLKLMQRASQKYEISLPDRQLCCAPLSSPEGKDYLAAMSAGANFARANRQVITQLVRDAFMQVMGVGPRETGLGVVYDVCHNIGKIEEHEVAGKKKRVCVHRKGATRAFPAGHPEVPEPYRSVGQPVFLPGSMGTYSYVLVGTEQAMKETFGTTAHGAGRMMSRTQASKQTSGYALKEELKKQGIEVRTSSYKGLAEEAPFAYKDVSEVVEVCHQSGISQKVARMKPMGVVKG
ncbi:MAG: RtcB family protein [Elusimicrobia bacterium]|nr:RtcB family protein [Elusimicrobiota bacterium]